MDKYLRVRLKSGDSKLFEWNKVDFGVDHTDNLFKVWEIETNENEMLLIVPLVNIEYYERIID